MSEPVATLRALHDALLTSGQDYSDVLLDAANEIERLRDEAIQLRQALGLLTTLHPTMEIDVNNPVQMALEIVSYVTESRDAEIERLRQQVTQRGARMQVMRAYLMVYSASVSLWKDFLRVKPEAAGWFDKDGAPL